MASGRHGEPREYVGREHIGFKGASATLAHMLHIYHTVSYLPHPRPGYPNLLLFLNFPSV